MPYKIWLQLRSAQESFKTANVRVLEYAKNANRESMFNDKI